MQAHMPPTGSTSAGNVSLNAQLAAENRQLVQLLRAAYPVANERPPDAKAAIDKSEQELNKHVTKSIHSATTSLDRAQKLLSETNEARRRHRNSWLAHLTESIKTWESQLEAFRKHSTALQEVAQKARADIATARQDIQRLSSQEVGTSSLAALATTPLSDEGGVEDQTDAEEDRLRSQLQGILQSCASSLGVQAQTQIEIQSIPSEEEQDERAGSKRQRSVEPGDGVPRS